MPSSVILVILVEVCRARGVEPGALHQPSGWDISRFQEKPIAASVSPKRGNAATGATMTRGAGARRGRARRHSSA